MAVYDFDGTIKADLINEPKVYNVMAYNVGNFDNSGGHDGYTGDDLEGTISKWIKFLGGCGANICLLSESRTYIDKNKIALSKNRIYDNVYKYISSYNPSVSWGLATLSDLPQKNIIEGLFTVRESSESKYHGTLITINNINVMFIAVHFNHGQGTAYDNARNAEINEIIQIASTYDNVIIGGDFNTDNANSLAIFKNNGFSLANNDIFGSFTTYVSGGAIDNMAIKGSKLKLKDVKILEGPNTNDHWPLSVDILIG